MVAECRTSESQARSSLGQNGTGGRLVYLDALRGLLLVIMAINHVPSDLHSITDHPLGYMSAAEGFVFLSGLMAGLVYTKRLLRDGVEAMQLSCWARARVIYLYHFAVYISVLVFVTVHSAWTGQQFPNAPLQMVIHPARALVVGPLLLSQPSLLDILPFYCAFMLLCPTLIKAYESGRRRQVLTISFLVWAAANLLSPQEPLLNTATFNSGAFNIFAWQILFVAGTAFGHAWARELHLIARPKFFTVAPILAAAALLLAVRHAWIPTILPPKTLAWLTNKNNLAPLRLFNTALLFWLIHAVIVHFPRALCWRPFALLGRESIAVFTIHVLVAYVIMAYPQLFAGSLTTRALSTALLLAVMALTAEVAARWHKPTSPQSLAINSSLASAGPSAQPGQWQTNDWPNRSASLLRRTNSRRFSGRRSSPKVAAAKTTLSIPGTSRSSSSSSPSIATCSHSTYCAS